LLLVITAPALAAQRRVIHVIVALCDNENQGIVKVPTDLGNGQEARNNLYWGARYGIKTFFSRSGSWRAISFDGKPNDSAVLERAVFFCDKSQSWLVADAYDGRHIKRALQTFMGNRSEEMVRGVGKNGAALPLSLTTLRVYVGHNGLMDFEVTDIAKKLSPGLDTMVFCCKSKSYFNTRLQNLGMRPRLLTTGLMAPEAYAVEAAVNAWIRDSDHVAATAKAYAKYQRISIKSASRLFAEGDVIISKTIGRSKPTTIDERVENIPCPEGFTRISLKENSYSAHIRRLALKSAGTPIIDYRGRRVIKADPTPRVINWERPSAVQQCADVAIRMRSEYLFANNMNNQISYRSLSGQQIAFTLWCRGRYSLSEDGRRINYIAGKLRSSNQAQLESYLQYVMSYANSASLARDLKTTGVEGLEPGDLYIQPHPRGRVGHLSIILDACRNSEGRTLYLFGYGFIPAQDFQLPVGPQDGWFAITEFKKHVSGFGDGKFHRFK